MRRDITLVDVELVFPRDLATIGIEAHHALLERRPSTRGVLDTHAIPDDDWCRASAVRHPPQEVLAVQRPLVDESRLARDAVTIGTARFRPVADRNSAGPLSQHKQTATHDECGQEGGFPEHRNTPLWRKSMRVDGRRPARR